MVEGLLHPLNIFIVGLGGAFLIPLLYRIGGNAVAAALIFALAAMTVISGAALVALAQGAPPIDILTGGAKPPIAINLRLGLPEAVFAFSVNLVALFGAAYIAREKYGIVLLYLLLVMGIQGMVMTRDLFNLFVFLEIVSIATYGLLSLRDTPAALSATFKYLMATVLASGFFLIGTLLLYAVTGLLNIDDLIASRAAIAGPIGIAGLIFLLACLLLELKPFPANGWGLDVYETARPDIAAMISGGVSAGVFFALLKLLPLFEHQLTLIAILAAITFVFSNLIGLRQSKAQRLLGYSSIGQMALLIMAATLLYGRSTEATMLLVIGGLFVNHLFAKVGLFWLAFHVGKPGLRDWSVIAGSPAAIVVFGIFILAISGLPPFPGFFAKWQLILTLASEQRTLFIAVILFGSLLEAAYMFRWFGHSVHAHGDAETQAESPPSLIPAFGMAALLFVSGAIAARFAGVDTFWIALPLAAGLAVWLLYRLPARLQGVVALAIVLVGGLWLVRDLSGMIRIYAVILLAGGLVVSIGCLARSDPRPGFYPFLAVMLLALPALPRAATSLEFIFVWELITLSSYFLVLQRRQAATHALRYILFSLAAAFFLLAGFAMMHAVTGNISLAVLPLWRPRRGAGVRAARHRASDQGRCGRRPYLAAGHLCGGRRRCFRASVCRDQQGRDLRPVCRDLCRDPFGRRIEPRACARLDRDAHHTGRRPARRAPGRHQAHAGLFQHEPARLYRRRDRADEPSRLGHGALPRRQPSAGQGHPVSRRRRDHPAHRHASAVRSGRPRPRHAADLRARRCCYRCDVGPAAAGGLRRQMAAAERDDGKGLVHAGR